MPLVPTPHEWTPTVTPVHADNALRIVQRLGRQLNEVLNAPLMQAVSSPVLTERLLGQTHMWVVERDEQVVAALYADNDYVFPYGSDEALHMLVGELITSTAHSGCVLGPADVVERVANSWHAITGHQASPLPTLRTFEVDAGSLIPIEGIPGAMRQIVVVGAGTLRDVGNRVRFSRWAADAVGSDLERVADSVDRYLAGERIYVWDVEEGLPVSMIVIGEKTAHAQELTLAYTPPGFRGNGYSRALLAAVSARVLSGGIRSCFLNTKNPVEAGLCEAIGYREVGTMAACYLLRA